MGMMRWVPYTTQGAAVTVTVSRFEKVFNSAGIAFTTQ